jgi:hypothetical protein
LSPSLEKSLHKKGLVEWPQGVGPESKPQYHKRKRKKKKSLFCKLASNVDCTLSLPSSEYYSIQLLTWVLHKTVRKQMKKKNHHTSRRMALPSLVITMPPIGSKSI